MPSVFKGDEMKKYRITVSYPHGARNLSMLGQWEIQAGEKKSWFIFDWIKWKTVETIRQVEPDEDRSMNYGKALEKQIELMRSDFKRSYNY